MLRSLTSIVVLVFVLSCGSGAPTTVGAIVDTSWRAHIDAAKRKDLEAVLEIYHDDVVYVVPGQIELQGLDAVREMEAQTLTSADVVDAVHASASVHVFDDVAYEVGTVVGPVRVGDAPARVVHYHFMAMWQRGTDGEWRIRYLVGQAPPGGAAE